MAARDSKTRLVEDGSCCAVLAGDSVVGSGCTDRWANTGTHGSHGREKHGHTESDQQWRLPAAALLPLTLDSLPREVTSELACLQSL